MTDLHAVYAVLDTIHGSHKVRVSEPMPWDAAIDTFTALEADPRPAQDRRNEFGRYTPRKRPIVNPGFTVYGRPVRFFAVRSADDPDWPSDRPVLSIRSTL